MTAKERQQMRRLEIENEQLREKISKQFEVYGNCLIEIIELRSTIELIKDAIGEK